MVTNAKDMLTIAEVELEYGLRRSTLYKNVKKGLITPYKKAGDRRSYFKRHELEKLTQFQPKKNTPSKVGEDDTN